MLHHKRVLVADDDPEVLRTVADALESLGAVVVRARTGGDIVERLAEEDDAFSLIVTDVAMPWMSGLQAMYAARSSGLSTPVIVMTAKRDDGISRAMQHLGSARFLRKPFDLTELESVASSLLEPAS